MGVARVGGDTAVLSDAAVLAAKRGEKMIGAPSRKKGGSGTARIGDSDNGNAASSASDIPPALPSSAAPMTDLPTASLVPVVAFAALTSALVIVPIAFALLLVN